MFKRIVLSKQFEHFQKQRQVLINRRRLRKLTKMYTSSNKNNDGVPFEKNRNVRRVRRFLRYLKSPSVQRTLRIGGFAIALGGGLIYLYVNYCHDLNGVRIPLSSKLLDFFKSLFSDQDSNVNDAVEKAKTFNVGKWCYLVSTFIVFGLVAIKFLYDKETVVEIDIQPEYISLDWKKIRIITGSALVILAHPLIHYGYLPVATVMYVTGWQMATHP